MDFKLTDDQIMLKETVRRIAAENFAPKAAEIDEKEIFSEENVKILAENGLLGIQIPEEYGGAGAGMLAMILAIEEVAKACAATSVILTTQSLASDPYLIAANKEQNIIRTAGGNELLFDDTDAKQKVRLSTKAKLALEMDDAKKSMSLSR